jgi:hypothetical protein
MFNERNNLRPHPWITAGMMHLHHHRHTKPVYAGPLEPVYPLVDLVPWLKARYPRIKLGSVPRLLTPEARASLLEAWEQRLRARYRLRSTPELYLALRQADFHQSCGDPLEWWQPTAFAAFSGELPKHRLSPDRLRDLLEDFQSGPSG